MRSGQPKACFVLPCSADNWQLESNWSKCTANGSQFFTVTCTEDGSQHFNAIVDEFNGKLHRLVDPRDDGEDVPQWLDERRLLTLGCKECQITSISEDGCVPLWFTEAGGFEHQPVLAATTPPALLQMLKEDNGRMQLFSTSEYGTTELPPAANSHSKFELREMSWSPDGSLDFHPVRSQQASGQNGLG